MKRIHDMSLQNYSELDLEKPKNKNIKIEDENYQNLNQNSNVKVEISLMTQKLVEIRRKMQTFINSLGSLKNIDVCLNNYSKIKNQFQEFPNYEHIYQIYERNLQKLLQNRSEKKNWNRDDILVLIWVTLKYNQLHNRMDKLTDQDWENISEIIPGKDKENCKFKWISMQDNAIIKQPWSQEEDKVLFELVQENGQKKWSLISKLFFKKFKGLLFRTSKQCREHYKNYLDTDIKKGIWTPEEDQILLDLCIKHNKKWSEITKKLGNRTENSVKNRYNSLIKALRKGKPISSKEEDNFFYSEDCSRSVQQQQIIKNQILINDFQLLEVDSLNEKNQQQIKKNYNSIKQSQYSPQAKNENEDQDEEQKIFEEEEYIQGAIKETNNQVIPNDDNCNNKKFENKDQNYIQNKNQQKQLVANNKIQANISFGNIYNGAYSSEFEEEDIFFSNPSSEKTSNQDIKSSSHTSIKQKNLLQQKLSNELIKDTNMSLDDFCQNILPETPKSLKTNLKNYRKQNNSKIFQNQKKTQIKEVEAINISHKDLIDFFNQNQQQQSEWIPAYYNQNTNQICLIENVNKLQKNQLFTQKPINNNFKFNLEQSSSLQNLQNSLKIITNEFIPKSEDKIFAKSFSNFTDENYLQKQQLVLQKQYEMHNPLFYGMGFNNQISLSSIHFGSEENHQKIFEQQHQQHFLSPNNIQKMSQSNNQYNEGVKKTQPLISLFANQYYQHSLQQQKQRWDTKTSIENQIQFNDNINNNINIHNNVNDIGEIDVDDTQQQH